MTDGGNVASGKRFSGKPRAPARERAGSRFLIPTARVKSRPVFFRLIRRKALALISTAREISTCTFPINSLKNAFSSVTVHNGTTCKPAISTVGCHCVVIPFYLDKKSDRKFIIMHICEMSIRLEAENTRS